MSVTDEVLAANKLYAAKFDLADIARSPARKIAILCCMDARINVEKILDLRPGDAHIIRNAGGIATEDVLRSLTISHHLQGTNEFIIINHTDCGMLSFTDDELLNKLEDHTGVCPVEPVQFHTFKDLEDNVTTQVHRIQHHPYLSDVTVRGFIYDVKSGQLTEVLGENPRASQQTA
jgi:carbonic anhydrase